MSNTEERRTVLVVEDEPNTRKAMKALLDSEGYVVTTASGGLEALEQFDSVNPDVVVTDLRMPGMDGLELLRRIRSTHSDLPVIVVTAFGAIETAKDAIRAGAVDYLQKPVDIDKLVIAIESAIEHRHGPS